MITQKRGKMKNTEVMQALNWRYATKKYDSTKKLSPDQWDLLKKSLQLAPSSYGLQPWKFLIVQNQKIRQALREVSWNQSVIEECSHLVVFTTLKEMSAEHIKKHIDNTARKRQVDPTTLDGYKTFMEQKLLQEKPLSTHQEWTRRQAYIAMGFLLETAALIQVDATPIEGLSPEKYDEILNLSSSKYATVAAITLGFRSVNDTYQSVTKSRFDETDIFQIID